MTDDAELSAAYARIPPHDLEAEAAVLSTVMNDRSVADRTVASLRPEEFYSESHRRIFEACAALHNSGTTPDVVTVATWLRDHDRLSQVGGMSYLTTVLNAAPGLSNSDKYAEVVRDKAKVRELQKVCHRILAQSYVAYGDVGEFVNTAEQAIYEATRGSSNRPMLTSMKGAVFDEFKRWEEIAGLRADGKLKSGVTGIPSGLSEYDRVTAGFHPGDLIIVGGRPGSGKSSLAVDFALYVASMVSEKKNPYVTAMFSMEMPRAQIASRAICSRSSVDLRKARTGDFTPRDWQNMVVAAGTLASTDSFLVNDTAGLTVSQIRSMLREAKSKVEKSGAKLVLAVVDYVQLINMSGGDGFSQEQQISATTGALKCLAKDMNLTVVALAQLNRSLESRDDKRPVMSDLKGSGAIEADADQIVFIYRDEYYNSNSKKKGIAELIVAKQRNGPTGTIEVRFDAQYTRFSDLPAEWAP